MSASNWPPSLKLWVSTCLGQMSEANKEEAQKELREMIKESHDDGSLWTRDWSKAKLKALEPKSFKRKNLESPLTQGAKKAKKAALASQIPSSETNERLAQRARRFEREHEIERQKQAGLLPSHEYSRHVNQNTTSMHIEPYGMGGLTTSSSSSLSRLGKIPSRRKYLHATAGDDEQADSSNVIDWDRFTIVGSSEKLFKNYLRLTSEPDPTDIRPYRVLVHALAEITRRWKTDGNYTWVCDQFKSLRQDLTVQRIKNEFTVQAYEMHARIALETGDLVEFNQCQSALRQLYELGLPGKSEEFLAYRILYLVHVRNKSDLNRLMATLTPQMKDFTEVKHALAVQRAVATSNYHAFFILFADAPNMGGYIMDHMMDRARLEALCIMSKAYHSIPLRFIVEELAFDSPTQAHDFLSANNAAFYTASTTSTAKPGDPHASKTVDMRAAHPLLTAKFDERSRRITIQGSI